MSKASAGFVWVVSWILASLPLTAFAATQGKTLVFARGGDAVDLDPACQTDGESFRAAENVLEGLVTNVPGTTDLQPALSTSWEISPDGLTYTFKLRPGVLFHDGTPFDADSVVFSFLRQHDPKHPAHEFGAPFIFYKSLGFDTLILGVEKVDPLTVRFRLARRDATFIASLAMQSFSIVSPTAVMKMKKQSRSNIVGTGAFRFIRWDRNQRIVLAANDQYWGGRPKVDTLLIRSLPDSSARLMETLAGNVHVMDEPNPDDVEVLRKKLGDKVQFVKQPGFNVGYLAFNTDRKPFQDVRVRQALAMAINKAAIIKAVYGDFGIPAVNPMPPSLWGYNKSIQDRPYDLDRARKLLAEAGLGEGFETTLWAMPVPRPYMPNGRKVAEIIQADFAKIGVKAKIVTYEWGTYLEKTRQGEHDMVLMGWTGDIGDPDNFLYVLLDKDNAKIPAQNLSFYRSEEVHQKLLAAKVSTVQAERSKLYEEAQALIFRDAPLVPLAHSTVVVPTQASVEGFVIYPTGQRRFAEVSLK